MIMASAAAGATLRRALVLRAPCGVSRGLHARPLTSVVSQRQPTRGVAPPIAMPGAVRGMASDAAAAPASPEAATAAAAAAGAGPVATPTSTTAASTQPPHTPRTLPEHLRRVIEYGQMYPDMLPIADITKRNYLAESLERQDMMKRRSVLDIPEFYVGSYLAITVSDKNAPGKKNKFVGICIYRRFEGLRHQVALRNIIDGEGVEIMYELYSPLVLEVQVLRLEKRLDPHLRYLRDALPEYSTVPWDMEPEQRIDGAPVPVNDVKVVMKPLPWTEKWEKCRLKGVKEIVGIPPKRAMRAYDFAKPWEDYDLMKAYRSQIPLEDQAVIWSEVERHRQVVEERHKLARRKKLLQGKPVTAS